MKFDLKKWLEEITTPEALKKFAHEEISRWVADQGGSWEK